MTTRPLGAQISHMLKDRGVDVIFGIPGVHNQEMYRGIEEAGITHVLARHEQGAGFMADGYARATGKPGVAYVITGPGLCNIMTPMGQAYSDSVPMLVISSCLDETAATRGQLHQMKDQEGAARTVCDWSETARTAEAAYALIDRALEECVTLRPRPKHISVPIRQLESLAAAARGKPGFNPEPEPAIATSAGQFAVRQIDERFHASVTPQMVMHVARQLLSAERPMFLIGGGARTLGRRNGPLRSVLARVKAASISTYAGRGIADPDDPLGFGAMLARPDSAAVLDAADCLIVLGSDLSEVDLWRERAGYRAGAHVVNIDAEVLAAAEPGDHLWPVDAAEFVCALQVALHQLDTAPASGWSTDIVAGYRDKWRAEIDAERPGILPVADALKEALPDDTMIYSDMTQFAYAAKEVYPMDRPGHWHHPYGFGTLGYALPAAIGGAIGRRVGETHGPTIAILGDYGFQYTVQELAVAVELELCLPIIIWDNGKLGEIEDSMIRAQIAPNAVVQRNPDFCKLAEAYGAASAAPQDLPAFQKAIKDALAAKGPTIIHVKSDIAF